MARKIVEELTPELWKIIRPCCKTVGFLERPAHTVLIRHKKGCQYAI